MAVIHLNTLEISRVTLNAAREVASERLAGFNKRIRAQFPTTPHFSKLPAVPAPAAGRDAFLSAMDDAKDLWTRVNALAPTASFTAPLLLQGGLTLAAFTARATADTQLGHTPDLVAAEARWNATETKAEITWEESAETDLQDYQLRAVPGLVYSADDATTLHTFLPADPKSRPRRVRVSDSRNKRDCQRIQILTKSETHPPAADSQPVRGGGSKFKLKNHPRRISLLGVNILLAKYTQP